VHDAKLFLLQFHAGSFVDSWQGETALLFSVWHRVGRPSVGYGVRISQVLIRIDALSSACSEKTEKEKTKNKQRKAAGAFFPGL
jgi:hypothetical protein